MAAKETLTAAWHEGGLAERLEGRAPDSTIRPPKPDGLAATLGVELSGTLAAGPESSPSELTWLPTLTVREASEDGSEPVDFVISAELGQGGMGRVHEAHQRSLGRVVAIKRVKADRVSKASMSALLQEARITGSLEHPNIVPLHALGLDRRGHPVLVMKKIEGVVWRDMVRDEDHSAWDRVSGDRLRWHIETLVQVCNAVEFSHSRGVVHRDLKPENVMLGDYGEVYVLDWGVAIDVTDETDRAANAADVVGTPCYMAPEMAGSGVITEQTDVYLLGSLLHEILTGRPPHDGENVYQVLLAACASDPTEFGSEVPEELAALCNRATHVDPSERPPSVQAFRLELASYLQHHSSIALADEARRRLAELQRIRDQYREPDDLGRLQRAFIECRFGFEQALKAWSGNKPAREGLDEAIELMIGVEIELGNDAAAAALLEELESPRPDLAERVASLRAAKRAERERVHQLEELAHGMDARVSSRRRARVLYVVCAAWAMLSLSIIVAVRGFGLELTYPGSLFAELIGLTIIGSTVWWFREDLRRTRFNRIAMATLIAYALYILVARIVDWGLGIPFDRHLTTELIGCAFIVLVFALTTDRRVVAPSLALLAAGAATSLFPDHTIELYSLAQLIFPLWVAIIWGRDGFPDDGEGKAATRA